jgi:hypothetical protein
MACKRSGVRIPIAQQVSGLNRTDRQRVQQGSTATGSTRGPGVPARLAVSMGSCRPWRTGRVPRSLGKTSRSAPQIPSATQIPRRAQSRSSSAYDSADSLCPSARAMSSLRPSAHPDHDQQAQQADDRLQQVVQRLGTHRTFIPGCALRRGRTHRRRGSRRCERAVVSGSGGILGASRIVLRFVMAGVVAGSYGWRRCRRQRA